MGSSTFSANARVTYNISGFGFTLPFGNYELAITDGDGEELCPRIPISQYDEFDGLWYGLSSDNTAAVVCAPVSETVDGGIIDVPLTATLGDQDYEVTGISDNAFSKYSGLKSLFMRRPVCMVTNAQALAGVSSVDVYVPADVYNDYAAVLVSRSNNLYSIINRISHRHLSGLPESLQLNSNYEFAVDFEPSENINHAIEVSDGGNGIMTFEVNDFMSGTRHVKARAVSVGQGAVTVTSAQPGVEAIAIPVSVSELSSVDNVAALRIGIRAAGGRIYVSGLASGDSVEVYDAAGIMVANRVADNSSLVIDGLGRGFYIVKAGSEVAKISL